MKIELKIYTDEFERFYAVSTSEPIVYCFDSVTGTVYMSYSNQFFNFANSNIRKIIKYNISFQKSVKLLASISK